MSRFIVRVASGVLATGAAAAIALAGAGAANAAAPVSQGLAPGARCAARRSMQRSRSAATVGPPWTARSSSWSATAASSPIPRTGSTITRSNYGTAYRKFPGPGYYSLCATNTGTHNTLATVQIRTDNEF